MTLGLGIGDWSTPELDGPGLRLDGTEPLAGRTGLLGAQERGLTLEEVGDGSTSDGAGGRYRRLLDVVGVEIEFGPDGLVNAAGDDFPPPFGHRLDPGAIDRR